MDGLKGKFLPIKKILLGETMTKDQKEKKIIMISDLYYFDWRPSKHWNFNYLQSKHAQLAEFVALRKLEVETEGDPQKYMFNFLTVVCGVPLQQIQRYRYLTDDLDIKRAEILISYVMGLRLKKEADIRLFRFFCIEYFRTYSRDQFQRDPAKMLERKQYYGFEDGNFPLEQCVFRMAYK